MSVTLPLDGVLDLHAFRPSELNELLTEWMVASRERGLTHLRVIHGKGSGVQRDRVIRLLDAQPLVASHQNDAGGNWGAQLVRLHPPSDDLPRIRAMIADCPRLMDALRVVASLGASGGPAGAWIGAGALRNALWHRWHGLPGEPDFTDIDVIWSDPAGPEEAEVLAHLQALRPALSWEVCNQQRLPSPAEHVAAAIARWPETATCVAARWTGELEILAPLGLSDLMAMIIRHNPACPEAAFRARLASKRWRQRFPRAIVMR